VLDGVLRERDVQGAGLATGERDDVVVESDEGRYRFPDGGELNLGHPGRGLEILEPNHLPVVDEQAPEFLFCDVRVDVGEV